MKVTYACTAGMNKPKYPYLAMHRRDGVLCLISRYGALMIEGGCYTAGGRWSWESSDSLDREREFDPLPIGTKVTLENT